MKYFVLLLSILMTLASPDVLAGVPSHCYNRRYARRQARKVQSRHQATKRRIHRQMVHHPHLR